MEKKTIQLIETLSNTPGLSGFEEEVVEIVKKELDGYGEMNLDHMLNLTVHSKKNTNNRPLVMLDAHSDEVGFMIHAIKPNGTMTFLPLGSFISSNVPAHTVLIRNNNGEYIKGVIASCPPHFMSMEAREKAITLDDMVIDVGSSSYEETVEQYGIGIGNPVVPDVTFEYNEKTGLLLGKAFDCRIGVACMIETFREIIEKDLKIDIVASLSVQEEIGLRGARVVVQKVKPDIAIVFEGCPADDTFTEPWLTQTALRKGPMLRHIDVSMVTNPRFQRFALDLARKHNIPVQESVRKGGGTNGGSINAFNGGVPVIVIGIPVRYSHTHYGFVSKEDYEAAKALTITLLETLDSEIIHAF